LSSVAGMAALWQAAQNSARLVEGAHDGLGMAVEVGEDFGVGDGAGDGRAGFIDQNGGDAHDVAAGAGWVGGDDGVAGGAGDAFLLKGALFGHALGEVAGEQGDGIVAALAVAGELDALFVDEGVDVFEVPGGAEAVGVDGLAPLVVGLLMAVAAVLGCVEAFGADELAGGGGGVGGQERGVFAEGVVVVGGDGIVERGGGAGDGDGCTI
jgi:hypothetical protein